MSKPSILLIPGAFALPEFYDSIVIPLAAKGYDIRALRTLTVSDAPGPTDRAPVTMYDDANLIATEAGKLADEGKDVILLAHSYGGVPMTESCKGLGKEERAKQGKQGGIVRLAYITCLVPALGETAGEVLKGARGISYQKIDEKGWLYYEESDSAAAAALIFSALPAEQQLAWIKRFPRHSAISFGDKLTHEGYKTIPVSYLVCDNDVVIPPTTQRDEIELIEKVSGKTVDVTSIQADHCPMACQTQKMIDWILEFAEKV